MSSPIPRRSLPHTITYFKKVSTDENQQPTFDPADGIEIKNVRIEKIKRSKIGSLGEMASSTFLLFIDAVSSVAASGAIGGESIPLSQQDRIEYNGDALTIRERDSLYGARDKIHHWEIYLS